MPVEALRKLLGYDAETGRFWWKYNERIGGGKVRIGAQAGYKSTNGRVSIGIAHRRYKAHRLAWYLTFGEWPQSDIDHRNGVQSDNRIVNLRIATHAQNMANTTWKSPSGYRGVTSRGKRWIGQISINNRSRYLGIFDTPEEAYAAVCAAIRETRREFARTD